MTWVGGVRSKLPDGSGPDRTPIPPRLPPCDRDRTLTPSRIASKKLVEVDGFFTPEFWRFRVVDRPYDTSDTKSTASDIPTLRAGPMSVSRTKPPPDPPRFVQECLGSVYG